MDAPARVFVSCGQSENSDEIKIAKAVGEELAQLGFQPFIALANQTLSGIQEFVFDALRNSESILCSSISSGNRWEEQGTIAVRSSPIRNLRSLHPWVSN